MSVSKRGTILVAFAPCESSESGFERFAKSEALVPFMREVQLDEMDLKWTPRTKYGKKRFWHASMQIPMDHNGSTGWHSSHDPPENKQNAGICRYCIQGENEADYEDVDD